MGNAEWMLAVVKENQIKVLKETNDYTEQFGLVLTEEDAALLVNERMDILKKQERVEFGEGILPQLIQVFCDSSYLNQENYRDSLTRLQEIFYEFKTEALEQLTDEELLNFMREQFDDICAGDFDYLEGTCLKNFAEAIRAGYQGFIGSDGRGEYELFDDVTRWDKELYLQVLNELNS